MDVRVMRLPWRRLGWQCLLALLMLLAQQGAMRHALVHATGHDDDHTSLHTQLCQQCLAFSASADALASRALAWALPESWQAQPLPRRHAQCAVGVTAAYSPRAPPTAV